MHPYLKQTLSQELSQLKEKLDKILEQLTLHPASNQQEEDLLLQQQLHTEKERIEVKIQDVQSRINNLHNEIVIGPIHVEFDDSTKKKFFIVKEALINPKLGYISEHSPLAAMLSTKNPGEMFTWETPSGNKSAKILSA